MIIYEQRIIEGENVIDTLNSWGKDGWELCCMDKRQDVKQVIENGSMHVDIIYYCDCIVKKHL